MYAIVGLWTELIIESLNSSFHIKPWEWYQVVLWPSMIPWLVYDALCIRTVPVWRPLDYSGGSAWNCIRCCYRPSHICWTTLASDSIYNLTLCRGLFTEIWDYKRKKLVISRSQQKYISPHSITCRRNHSKNVHWCRHLHGMKFQLCPELTASIIPPNVCFLFL